MATRILRTTACLSMTMAVCTAGNLMILPELDIGRSLQTSATITLAEAAPEEGLEITVGSDDPARLLMAKMPDEAGAASIVVRVRAGFRESAEFWVHGLADRGMATYTAVHPKLGKFRSTVRLHPAAIVLIGPAKAPSFSTTPNAPPSRISLHTVRLDSSSKIVEPQYLVGGKTTKIQLRTTEPAVGKVNPQVIDLLGGSAVAVAEFQPLRPGTTAVDVLAPPGFASPAEHASVTAVVKLPGISLTDEGTMIGQNLQIHALVGLGEAAPEAGLTVRVACTDPSRLLVSRSANEIGSGEIDIHIPPGQVSSPIYLQALGSTGSVTCAASAPGFRTRTSDVLLAPSGVVLMYKPYGPPDEAEVLREVHGGPSPTTALYMHLEKTKKIPLNLWTVRLDPQTLRSADITVQPLRAGYSLDVEIHTSNPEVGSVTSPVRIEPGSEVGVAEFTPSAPGKSVLTVVTPSGFVKSANSTSLTTVISK